MSSAKATPKTIHGGCLCEKGIRYEVNFPLGYDFSTTCTTCQCVQCRKNTGALIARLRKINLEDIAFTTQKALKKYYATPGIARAFCGECGSFVYWHSEKDKYLSLAVGTIDKEDLLKYGPVLAEANLHIWCAEEVLGVTDKLPGEKWRYDDEGGDAVRM